MDIPFLIHVKYLVLPRYLNLNFADKREWLVYATNHEAAMHKLDIHLRSFLIDEPEVGDSMMLDMSSVTILCGGGTSEGGVLCLKLV
jgi:hypothetical protein